MFEKIKEGDWGIIKLFLALTGASILVPWLFAVMLFSAYSLFMLIEYLIK